MTIKRILYLVPFSFNENIFHAGGQSINYYVKRIYNSNDFSTAVLCLDDFYNKELQLMCKEYKNAPVFFDSRKKKYS